MPMNINSFSDNYKNTKLTVHLPLFGSKICNISGGMYPDGNYIANAVENNLNTIYQRDMFRVIYDPNTKKMWFTSRWNFSIYNSDASLAIQDTNYDFRCKEGEIYENNKPLYKNSQNWGLGYNLGFNKEDIISRVTYTSISLEYLRHDYSDAHLSSGSASNRSFTVVPKDRWFLETSNAIKLQPDTNIYIEMESQNHNFNNILECRPYQNNVNSQYNSSINSKRCSSIVPLSYNTTHSQSHGIATWDFSGSIGAPAVLLAQGKPNTFTEESKYKEHTVNNGLVSVPKIFNPPLKSIRKLKLKLRFHDGRLVDLGTTPWKCVLHFRCSDD